MFNVYLLTDPHYFSENIYEKSSKSYLSREAGDQICLKEAPAIIDEAFRMFVEADDSDILLIPGDLINCGEKICHTEFIEKLRELKEKGKRVYVTTATHDYIGKGYDENSFFNAYYFSDTNPHDLEPTHRDELRELYYDFGRNDALSVHEKSMSYAVQLTKGVSLLAMNDDGNGCSYIGYYPDCLDWIAEQADAARERGDYCFMMTHHPLLPPLPVFESNIGIGIINDWRDNAPFLRSHGINLAMTGHTHMQNITRLNTEYGDITDVSTASIDGAGACLRKLSFDFDNKKIEITSLPITDVPGIDMDGLTFPEYFRAHNFTAVYRRMLHNAAYDTDAFAQMTGKDKKKTVFIKPIARFADNLTFSKLAGFTKKYHGIKKDEYKNFQKPVKEAIFKIIECYCAGDAPFTPDTYEYKILMALAKKSDRIIRLLHIPLKEKLQLNKSLNEILEPMLYNTRTGSDDHCSVDII